MATTVIVAILMIVGTVGIVVPVLPGLVIVWLATGLWAFDRGGPAWWMFAITSVIYAAGLVTQYLIPGKRMKAAGVQTRTLVVAVLAAMVGFFVIPVVGVIVGFVGGIFGIEYLRSRDLSTAWTSTKHALKAVGLSMAIELGAAFLIVGTWVTTVVVLGPS